MLEEKDVERMKEIFVTRQECQETTKGLEKEMSKSNVRMSVMETELKQIKWLVGLVLAGTVTNLLSGFFRMIGV